MAIWIKWTKNQHKIWDDWVADRPKVIKAMIATYNLYFPNLYLLKTTGQKVILNSLNEDGTVSVHVLQKFNPRTVLAPFMEKTVFGINPADLEECDWDGEVEEGEDEVIH